MSQPDEGRDADNTTFVDRLHDLAGRSGGDLAFRLLADPGDDPGAAPALSYADLDRRARAIAVRLGSLGLSGERALLVYPPGLEFIAAFFGCLYAGVVAVPVHVPRANRPLDRLRAIVDDARPRAILTAASLLGDSDRWASEIAAIGAGHRVATDRVDDPADDWRPVSASSDGLAFLQYTSGSTATPKGVMVSHRNLIHNSEQIRTCFGSTRESRGVFWLPLYHDMGLIGGVLQTVFCGGSSTWLSPVAFLQQPARWLRAISETGATISGGPDFAYDLCCRKIDDAAKAELDLSKWDVAFNGAEPVRAETIDRFVEAFAPCGFRREAFLPCYGLAESTLLVSGRRSGRGPVVFEASGQALGQDRVEPGHDRRLVGSGGMPEGNEVAIVDPESGRPCGPDRVGEVWVRGGSVAGGYWNQPEATETIFRATLPDGSGPFLRTGDLGFVRDGELFVAGRLKDLVIVGGRNIYPNDIEWTAERAHPSLRPGGGGAFSVEADGQERLSIVLEVERLGRGNRGEEVIAAVRKAVAETHEVDLHAVGLIKPMALPRTSSGKVRRHACREAFLNGEFEYVGQWTREPSQAGPAVTSPVQPEETPRDREVRPTSSEIAEWLCRRIAGPLGVNPGSIDRRETFAGFGLGSVEAVGMAGDLETWLGRPLAPTLAYEYPTIDALSRHLAGEAEVSRIETDRDVRNEPIAVVGIGCRFPKADGPEAFWTLLSRGLDAIGDVPEGRPGVGRAGYLDRVDRFDADFFGISPREAAAMDPQQRLLLEVAWEAMEDAAIPPRSLAGESVGVFVGVATDDYSRLARADAGDVYEVTGNAASIAANRLSFAFDLRGPSVALDTACSSSLVAVEWACRSLRLGESTTAIAGGVNLLVAPEVSARFVKGGFLAPDGRCKTFSSDADGYVRGEGAGLVVLKPLSAAIADGNRIYALIRGGAINQDGRTNGLTAPNPRAQEAVLPDAYRAAGVLPGSVRYVEAHGTGTPLGDPIEAKALGAVLAEGRATGNPCLLGSVKTNIGHLEAAAGVAGLIKVALMLDRGVVPPTLNCREPNPQIPLDALPLRLAVGLTDWSLGDGPIVAGVSSFGFGGTNAHLVLESAPTLVDARFLSTNPQALPPLQRGGTGGSDLGTGRDAEGFTPPAPPLQGGEILQRMPNDAIVLPLSARHPEALRALASSVVDDLISRDANLSDYAFTASVGRDRLDHRLAVVAGSATDAVDALKRWLGGTSDPRVWSGRRPAGGEPGLVFVFSGQGGLWAGAGRDLLDTEPAYRAMFEAIDARVVAGGGRSLLDGDWPDDPEWAQVDQFAIQVSLAALYRSWGVEPSAVVGHSLGEIAAAHVAGAIGLDEAIAIVRQRGRLMAGVRGIGRTAAVGLSEDEARRVTAGGHPSLAIAAINSPRMTTISGDAGAVEALVARVAAEGRFARMLAVDIAFHGPAMDGPRAGLEAALRGLEPRSASIPFVSTVTGQAIDGRELGAGYWGRNLRDPVLFSSAIGAIADGASRTFLELGPHPIHRGAIVDCLGSGSTSAVVGSLRRGEPARLALLGSLAAIDVRGHAVAWGRVNPPGRIVRIPSYPWQGERHWIDEVEPVTNGHYLSNGNGLLNGHPLGPVAAPVHEVRWIEAEVAPSVVGGRWVIVADDGGVGSALKSELESQGSSCEFHPPLPSGEGARRAGEGSSPRPDSPQRSPADVVYLAALDLPEPASPDGLERDLMSLMGDLLERARGLSGRLWIVTRGAQPASTDDGPTAVAQSAVWGLGRSIALQYPAQWGGLIDLDPSAPPDIAAIAREIRATGPEDQIAFRAGRRLVPRLVAAPAAVAGPIDLRPEATYLVTGGLGDLGLRVAAWMVDRGARRIILLGRRGLPGRNAWDGLPADDPARPKVDAILAMERAGATILVDSADVGDWEAMAARFDRWSRDLPPIRGIIHAAGVVRVRDVGVFDPDSAREVVRPKVAGAWALHDLSRSLPLDVFAMFSSVAGVLGSRGMPDYSAANAFLDGLAHHRRALGLPALSVNWGPWAGAGMVDTSGSSRSLALMGFTPIEADAGLDALGRLMSATASPQALVATVDWTAFASLHETGRGRLLDGLSRRNPARSERLHELTDEALVAALRKRLAVVLRLPNDGPDPDRPLNTLGIDSLMAIELKAGIEADLGVVLPLTTFLEATTIARLAGTIRAGIDTPEAGAAVLAPGDGPIAESVPSFGQQSLWYAHQMSTTRAAFNIAGAARVRPGIDLGAFREALATLVDRHEALRTAFPEVGGKPTLRVLPRVDAPLSIVDASGWTEEESTRRREEEANRPFDLERGPLLRVTLWGRADGSADVAIVLHHIVGDFWTVAILVEELIRLYNAGRSGVEAGLPPVTLRYTDFVRWQAAMLAGPEGARLEAYWREKLADPPPVLELPTDRPRPSLRGERGAVRHMAIGRELASAVVGLAEATGTSLHTVLLAAFEVLLGRHAGQDDFAVGSAVAGRTRPGLDAVLGYFVNLVPMRADLSGDPSFDALLGRVRRVVHEGLEHQEYPFGLMVDRLAKAHAPDRSPIFQAMFIYQQSQRLNEAGLSPFALGEGGHRVDLGGISAESLAVGRRASLFDLTMMAALAEGGLSLSLEYSTDLFDEATADRLLARFRTLLAGIVADPHRRISELPLLTDAERSRVVGEWAGTDAPALSAGCIHHLFEARARATPDAIAVVDGDRRATYREIDVAADRMAGRLARLGVGPGSIVGICAARSPELIAGLLGVLKAGAAYLPVDPETPPERLAVMLADAGATILLVDPRSKAEMAGRAATLVDLNIQETDGERPGDRATPGDVAYVIYTSGSTGTPKGVAVSHASLVGTYHAWERAYGLDAPPAPHLQAAGVGFDVFTGDWVRALGSGGSLILCPRETAVEPEALYALMDRERVAFAEFVPAIADKLADWLDRTGRRLDHVRLLAVGSDMWRVGPYRRLRRLVGPGARVVNSYGVTEATIDSAFFEGDPGGLDDDRPVPIGRPLGATRAYVLDRGLQPTPEGVPGELFLGGPGVSLGYLNRPALTAERFLPDPFGNRPGGRIYRTGDLAVWRAGGTLEVLGRSDHQVKIRGVRIELGEVESALLRHERVREAAVIVQDDPSGRRSLSGFVVASKVPAPEAAELRRWLKDVLPEAMIPATIQVLDALPLSANGKVDRRALAAIDVPAADRPEFVAPRGPIEAELARITGDLLGVDRIGVLDNFLELGLDSILIIQVASRARQAGLRVDPVLFFRHQTLAELAAAIAPAEPREPAVETLAIPGFDREAALAAIDGAGEVEDVYPLSPVQEGMHFHSESDPGSGAYVEQFTCDLIGTLDPKAFADSWQDLLVRHATLRTAIRPDDDGRPLQAVLRDAPLPFAVHDLTGLSPDEQTRRLADDLAADRRLGFAPSLAPMVRVALYRLGTDRHAMVWTSHHLVLDGWSIPILLGDLMALYRGETLAPTRPFRDYIAWLRRRDLSAAEAYWRRTLAGFSSPTPIGLDAGPDLDADAPFAEREEALDEATTAALRAFARSNRLTLATVIDGAWALLLSRYAGRDDVVFGVTVSGRPAELEGVESMVGVFINTLPLRVAVDEEAEVVPWLRAIGARLAAIREHEASPLVDVRRWSDVPGHRPLFETIAIVQNTPIDPALASAGGPIRVESPRIFDQTSFPITLTAIPGTAIALRLGYDARRFDGASVGRMALHLRRLLEAIADGSARHLAELSLTSESEPWIEPDPVATSDLLGLSDVELDDYIEEIRRSMGEAAR